MKQRKLELLDGTEKLKDLQVKDAVKRYAYLLGKTDLFAHFLKLKKNEDGTTALDEIEKLTKATPSAKSGDRRRRKTEKEEDEELLQKELQEDAADEPQTSTVIEESPSYVEGGTMRTYQLDGLNWMINLFENGVNGILADEMGLGKTLQTISFLGYLKYYKNVTGPHLVIVPKSTLHNWCSEFKRWVPGIDAFMFHGPKEARQELITGRLLAGNYEVCVTSYEMILLEKSSFKRIPWVYVAIDEAHRIKNENSSLSQIVRVLHCRNRLLVTGTPLQNNLHELWALLNFLLPDIFSSSDDFDKWFENQDGDQQTVISQLHKVLQPFLLRRVKADVEKSLLPKKRINLYVGMSSMQRKWYQKILEKDIAAVNGVVGNRESKARLQNIVMQLRKCCNHPYLFDGAEPGPPYTTDVHLVENAGKMILLDKLLGRMKAQGSRVLLFSQMSRVLDILEDYAVWRGYKYCRIDGNTPHEDRVSSIDAFNAPDSEHFLFLLTTRAGGLGINLATADIVIMYDSDWNPQVDLQAEDRAHRIGQKKQVVVFRFITENAVEEKVIERATQKLRLDQLVIQSGRSQAAAKAIGSSKEDLLSMIQHGAQTIFEDSGSTIADEDIETILKRGEEKTEQLAQKYASAGLDELQQASTGSVLVWEGEDFSNKRKNIGSTWIQPAKRERKANYAIDDYYRDAMRAAPAKPAAPKAPKLRTATLQDFQFPPKELVELQERELYAHLKSLDFKHTPQTIKTAFPKLSDADPDILKAKVEETQAKIDAAVPLTERETSRKEDLLSKGFDAWSKRDFTAFVKANEKFGRKDLINICKDIEGKTFEEVRAYSEVFWKRGSELADWERVLSSIERGEAKLQRILETQDLLTSRVNMYRVPLHQLKIQYGNSRGKNYTEEEDRYLVVTLEKFGFGTDEVYEKIRENIRSSPLFRFDWFFKSRTSQELQRRCATLITLLQREAETEAAEAATAGQNAKGAKAAKPIKR
ncbi:hypothetical protein CXG81DRAFT_14771 [Caulochytrium protostelioides]|uniref:Putative transcription activator snf2l1 n=1 Tax=Caulochytrium protostelioides TaxID=1555241 RepID=A0A4P9WX98_9FUNG|nr:putative transcription activator snf2l1 [Caulochytrium protostelioides]RKO99245.1 hypothetical protein CXG81DRAFT_14771 [Caulochytrium protostelioides]|eukprot:RKO99245.1 hypothetical protein CXG81DRAFT_14771 [Caulochytrium protostelioides]